MAAIALDPDMPAWNCSMLIWIWLSSKNNIAFKSNHAFDGFNFGV
jgi:hypothetical protein